MLYLSPVGNSQQVASNGAPLVGGKIYTYLAGSTTPAATYTDNTGSTPQANPIILDSNGLPLSPIWLQGGVSYKLVIQTAAGVTMRTVDNVSGINDTTNTQNEWVDSGLTPTYISGTSFSLVGDQRAIFQQYRRVKTQNTSGTVYGTVSSSTYSLGVTTIIVANDGTSALDSGLSTAAYGFMSATNPSIPVLFVTNADEQKQTFTAFTTAGTAPAYTLTPSPAITAYTAGQRFRVKFHAAGTAGNMAISSLSAKTLKQFAPDGTKVAATITTDLLADVEYDGTDLIILNPLMPDINSVKVIPVRQTLLSCPITAGGLPSLGGSTGSTTFTTSGTMIVTAANGESTNGGVNRVGSITNASWTGLSTNGTMYLYLDIAESGTCTTGSTTIAPVYQFGGTPSTTSGAFTFNWGEMVGYVGNGSTAAQTYRVFVGEAAIAGNVVTSVTWYAIKGRYDSGYISTFPSTQTSLNHYLGLVPDRREITIKCLTAEGNYSVGDVITPYTQYATSTMGGFQMAATSKVISFIPGPTVYLLLQNKTTGGSFVGTLANWAYRVTCSRNW